MRRRLTACLLIAALALSPLWAAALAEPGQEPLLELREGAVPEQAEFSLMPAAEPEADGETDPVAEPEADGEPDPVAKPEVDGEPDPAAESGAEGEPDPGTGGEPEGAEAPEPPAAGWTQSADGWRYVLEDGSFALGWQLIDGAWYRMDESGVMLTGWQLIDGRWYWFNAAGAMATGWRQVDGKWYWFNAAGAMITGWRQIDGKWYWFSASGAMITGWRQIDGKWYWFSGSGAMAAGWRFIDGFWYWFDGSGAMATGWREIGGRWYHLRSWGAMDSGWSRIDGRWYCLGSGGALYDGVTVEQSGLRLGEGQSAQLRLSVPLRSDGTPMDYTVTSNKISVAAVQLDGSLSALKRGSATITVRAEDGRTATCGVEVLRAPSSIRVSPECVALTYDGQTGTQQKLKVTLSSGAFDEVAFSSGDERVARVDGEGVITAVGLGQTVVTATACNGLSAACAVTVTEPGAEPPTWRDTHPMCVVAHRGGCGYWPENTLEAFRKAPSTGADAIELDVRTTSDGVEVIHHDQTFTGADGAKYDIPRRTYAELKAAKPGLCTLDEALEVISAGGLDLVLEMKNNADAKKCLAAVKKYGLQDRTLYISFNTDRLTDLRKLDANAPLGFICQNLPSHLDSLISRLSLTNIMRRDTYLTQADIDRWHGKGILVGVWTVNEPGDMKKWYDMGVDYLTSDYPDLAVAAKNQ